MIPQEKRKKRIERECVCESEGEWMGLEKEEVRRTKWALVETRSVLFCLRRDNQRGRAKHEHQQEHSCATCRAFFEEVGEN